MKNKGFIVPAELTQLPRDVRLQRTLSDVAEEYFRARRRHAPMHSAHEGYAVILEELDELWDEVKRKDPNVALMKKEATQLAAMAVSFIVECCEDR